MVATEEEIRKLRGMKPCEMCGQKQQHRVLIKVRTHVIRALALCTRCRDELVVVEEA